MVSIINKAPVSTRPEPVSSSTTFVKNPVSETSNSNTKSSTSSNPMSTDSKPANSKPSCQPKVTTSKDECNPEITSKDVPISVDKPESNVPEKETDRVHSPDQPDPKFQRYLRLIKDLVKNKPEYHKNDLK